MRRQRSEKIEPTDTSCLLRHAGRALALDVGSVRIGVAVSCPRAVLAQPLAVVPRWPPRGQPSVAERLGEWAQAYQVHRLVVGRPLRMSGDSGPAVAAVEAFMADLFPKLSSALELVWWDERLTTRAAERAMIAGGMRRQARRQKIDEVAATLLLQSYLDACHTGPGGPPDL